MKQLLFALLAIICFSSSATAKDVYGYMTGNGNTQEAPIGIYKFDSTGTESPQLLSSLTYQFWGGAYAEGYYYLILSDDYQGYITNGLCRYNLETGKLELGYAYQDYLCSDMTYDYSTQTMYAIIIKYYGEDVQHQLVKINLQNGAATNVATLNDRFSALACNYYGDLYAISSSSKLYRMDKNNGNVTLIGETGVHTDNSQAQSMDFDRETNELYWSGLDAEQNAFFIKLNTQNASVEKRIELSNNSLIVGLHIPFVAAADGAPARPANLKIKAEADGVHLDWTNPSTTYNGESLSTGLTKIEISREGKLVHTIDNPIVGENATWTDTGTIGLNGEIRYTICAYNEVGKGDCASATVMLGEDIPSPVSELKISNNEGNAVLTWTAPQTGKNGGMLNPENLYYKITRTHDGIVFDEIKETVFTDTTIDNPCFTSYTIACYNKQGESDAIESETIALGKAINPPYSADFTKPEYSAHWRIIDNNNDGNTWSYNAEKGEYNYFTNFFNAADDYLTSVSFNLEAGINYVFSYSICAKSLIGSSENIRIRLFNSEQEKVIEELNNFSNSDFETRSVPFTIEQNGEYSISVDALSKPDQNNIIVKAFAIDVVINKDLSLTKIEGRENVHVNKAETYQVTVTNKGKENITGFTLALHNSLGEKLGEKQADIELASNETATIDLDWIPNKAGDDVITVTVTTDGDEIASNNSLKKSIYAADENQTYLVLGGKDSKPNLFPVAFEGYPFSCSETIYKQNELNCKNGKIYEICYEYENFGEILSDKHLKVFMGNTEQKSVISGWIPEADMELVFDGNVTFNRGKHLLRITFNKPFEYTGQNLCLLCQKHDDTSLATINFYATDFAPEVRTVFYESDYPEVILSDVAGSTMLNYIEMLYEECNISSIEQTSISESNIDCDITLNDRHLCVGTDKVDSIRLIDTTGKIIASGADTATIALPKLTPGIYVVIIENNGYPTTDKLIVK